MSTKYPYFNQNFICRSQNLKKFKSSLEKNEVVEWKQNDLVSCPFSLTIYLLIRLYEIVDWDDGLFFFSVSRSN